jgi:hypothetical protein
MYHYFFLVMVRRQAVVFFSIVLEPIRIAQSELWLPLVLVLKISDTDDIEQWTRREELP